MLKKCHLLNVFGSLAVAGMLVMGGAAAAGAATATAKILINGTDYTDTADINCTGAVDFGVYTNAATGTFTGKKLNVSTTPGELGGGNVGLWATSTSPESARSVINFGQTGTTESIDIEVTDNSSMEEISIGVWSSGGQEEVGGEINLSAETVTIKGHSNSGWIYGIYAQNTTTTTEYDQAVIDINAGKTYIDVTSGQPGRADAIVAMSQGIINIESDLYVNTQGGNGYAIVTRGDSTIAINTSGTHIVQMNGDINFNYDKKTSGTRVDADVDITLNGADSYWNGNTLISWDEKPDDSKLTVSEMTLTVKDGATWTPTAIEETADQKYTPLNNLILDDGNIDVNKGVEIAIDKVSGTGFLANEGTVTLTSGALEGRTENAGIINLDPGASISDVTFEKGDGTPSAALIAVEADRTTLNGGMATGENASASVAGVIVDADKNVTINDVAFKGNTLSADRNYPIIGAVTANLGAEQSLTITDSTFANNTVKLTGTGSSGSSGGAAVSVKGQGTNSKLTIIGSTFSGNRYDDTKDAVNGAYGGAIGVQNASVTLDNVTLTGNSADSGKQVQGGGYYQSVGSLDATQLKVSENNVEASSNLMGAGMVLWGTSGSIAEGSEITNNNGTATGSAYGGGLYMRGSRWGGKSDLSFTISGTTFSGNSLTATAGAYGGGLYVKGDTANSDNPAEDDLGAQNGKINLTLTDVTFDSNTVNGATASQGGALYVLGAEDTGDSVPDNATVTVNNSTFTGNKAEGAAGQGGAIYNAGTLTVDGTRFENNTASAQGGAIYVHPKAELDVTNSYFKGNVGTAGGAIAMFGDNGAAPEHSISNTVFEGNTADRTGDKLGKGGAIAILQMDTPREQYTTKLDLNGVTFIGNTSNGTGGAIHSEYGTLTITDATFSGNSAEQQGGAIYNDANSSITFKGDNLFTGNTAAEGKDIYNEGTLDFAGTNTQMDGGMVMADGTMTVANSQVNMAELDARAGNITVTGSELSVSKLTGNTLGSSLTVDTDGIVNIGNLDTTKLGEAMNDAGMGDGSAVLALNTSVSLTGDARLVVGTDASDKATAVFGDNSLLVVDAEGVADKQVIHADGNGKTAFIHSNAQLRIINAVADEYVTVLNGFDTIRDEQHALNAGWVKTDGVENLDYMLSSYAMITDEKDVVVVSKLNDPTAALPGIDPDLAPVLNEVWANKLNDVDSPDMGVRFLSRAARADYINGDAAKSAATIESAARIAFAGAVPQMTKMASDAATNAVVNRLGFANPADGAQAMNAEGKIVDRNTTGFALWIAPLWQNQHGWGMEAGNLDYGFNGNLGGVSLGADYTFENAIRAGITFNIGGGYAESSGGDLNSTENRMTFWGLGAYAGWNYENFGLMADVSYTSTWNDLEQDLDPGMGMGDLEADVQATAISAGLRAEYKLETSVLDIIPHIGVRYMSLNTWGYDVDANGGTVLEGDGFHQDIWTFPIGVTFSKDFTLDSGWFFKPSVDFSVIPAAGDIKAKHDVQFTGAPAVAEMETQMMDYLTWQGGVGIQMGNDNLSFGVNYTLQAGQNTTGHGVFGSFRYEF